jgi:hypothetical protein
LTAQNLVLDPCHEGVNVDVGVVFFKHMLKVEAAFDQGAPNTFAPIT